MKNLKARLSVFFVFSLLIMSCETNDDAYVPEENQETTINYDFGASVSKDFMGQIIDEDKNPILNATVKIGSSQAFTDANGIFIIKNASVKSNFAYIKATKAVLRKEAAVIAK